MILILLLSDRQLIRRLNVKAEYDVPCNLLSDPVAKSTLNTLARTHFDSVNGPLICDKGEY